MSAPAQGIAKAALVVAAWSVLAFCGLQALWPALVAA